MATKGEYVWASIVLLGICVFLSVGSNILVPLTYNLVPFTLSDATVSVFAFAIAWFHHRNGVETAQSLAFASVGCLFATEALVKAGMKFFSPAKPVFIVTSLLFGLSFVLKYLNSQGSDD